MSQENPSSQLDVEFIYLPVINYSMQQNRIPVVRLLSIKNNTEHPLADLKVFLTLEPEFASVSPVMEVLADKYKELNSGVTIEIQQTGSGAGIQSTIEGVCDIGMASRALEDEESKEGLESKEIALDGIAVIVNQENPVEDLSSDTVKGIFTGGTTTWDAAN